MDCGLARVNLSDYQSAGYERVIFYHSLSAHFFIEF